MKRVFCFLLSVLMLSGILVGAVHAESGFSDVDPDAWYAAAVEYCRENSVMVGIAEDRFDPHGAVTRAMLVTAIGAMMSVDTNEYGEAPFTDVTEGSGYAPYVAWANEKGIAVGVGGSEFAPQMTFERQELALMLYKTAVMLGVTSEPDTAVLSDYSDSAKISSWAREGVAWAVSEGIFEGYGASLMPRATADRAQMAQVLMTFRKTIYMSALETKAVDIGSGRHLMLEEELCDPDFTTSPLNICTPKEEGSVFSFDAPYEASVVYHSISRFPNGVYRMYYKATEYDGLRRICYIESTDGINWSRPLLPLNPYNGAPSNIVTNSTLSPDNLFVFWDTNPDCYEGEVIKGIYGQWGDGLFWEFTDDGDDFPFWPDQIIMGTPEETGGAFYDTLNTAYWSSSLGCYVAFVRGYHWGDEYVLTKDYVADNPMQVTRDIRVAFSDDFIHWTTPQPLVYSSGGDWQIYANAIAPYYRAEGLFVGMPTRFERREADGDALTDVLLMHSRDGVNWARTEEAWLYPDNGEHKWIYPRAGYPCVGIVESGENEMSFYMSQAEQDAQAELYRYSLRIDGFAFRGDGRVITRPVVFDGERMTVNCKTSENGRFRVTVTDCDGNSVKSAWQSGDGCDLEVDFDAPLAAICGKEARICFELVGCELYSFNIE